MKTTQQSLALLRKANCIVAVVEKWVKIPGKPGWRQDLWGFADIIFVTSTGQVGFVQTTDHTNVSKRRRKILENQHAIELMARGIPIIIHGWKKKKLTKDRTGVRYECHIEEIKSPISNR